MISITIVKGGFHVSFEYKPFIVSAVKRFAGAEYNAVDKYWFIPSSSEKALMSWVKNLKHKIITEDEIKSFEIEELPELTIDIPLKREMFPYQKKGVAYALDKKKVIVGDQMGLGKTGQAIATAVGLKAKCILVICPATVKENWKREWKLWTGKDVIILSDRTKKTWVTFYKVGMCNVFITNFESLQKYFVQSIDQPKDPKTGKLAPLLLSHISFNETINLFDMVIVDEIHRCKDGNTKQSKFVMGITRGKEQVLVLTGTPIVNKPFDLLAQLYIIGQLHKFGGYKYFINRYCDGPNKASNLKELNFLMHKHCFYRREKKEVLKDLPDKLRNIIKVKINNRQEYDKAEQNLIDYLKENLQKTDGEITKALRGETMVLIGILKKISARGKIQNVIEHIQEVVDAGEKIVVFAWHKDIVKDLKAAIPEAVTIIGENTMEERQTAVDSFQNNKNTQVIICNIKSGGVGITLTASSRVLFIELPWHPADCDQCEDRCHRIGQKDSVEVSYFLGENTIDGHIYSIIEKKRVIANQVTGSEEAIETKMVDEFINLFLNKNVHETADTV